MLLISKSSLMATPSGSNNLGLPWISRGKTKKRLEDRKITVLRIHQFRSREILVKASQWPVLSTAALSRQHPTLYLAIAEQYITDAQ